MAVVQERLATSAMLTRSDGRPRMWRRRDTGIVALLMGLMLVRGLLVGTITWPWYAPDEPDHVELALLTQTHGPFVERAMQDAATRLAIARSQYQWHVTERPPRDDDLAPGTWHGQVGRQPPLYYLLAGWAAALMAADGIEGRLAGMRLVSALIGASVVAGAYVFGRLIAPSLPAIAFGLGAVVLFQTGLGLLAGAVTNDILAAAMVTWAVIACVSLLRAPRTPARLALGIAAMALAVGAALATKRTTVAVVLPAALTIVFLLAPLAARRLRSPRVWAPALVALTVAVIGLVAASVVNEEQRAVNWRGDLALRVRANAPELGQHAMHLGDASRAVTLSQPLSSPVVTALRGQPITLGIWHRLANPSDTPRPLTIRLEQRVSGETRPTSATVTVGPEWRFSALPARLNEAATSASVVVSVPGGPAGAVLVDGATLAQGSHTTSPGGTGDGRTGVWGDGSVNLLTNSSFEARPIGLRPWLRQAIERLTNRPLEVLLVNIDRSLNGPTSWDEFRYQILEPFLETLWGRPGRTAELNLPWWWYRLQAVVAGLACLGLVVGGVIAVRAGRLNARSWQVIAVLGTLLIGTGAIALGPYLLGIYTGPPFGRYLLPAVLVLATGYVAGIAWVWPRRFILPAVLVLVVVLAALDSYALLQFLPNHFAIRPPTPG